jgi:hypothetical protein
MPRRARMSVMSGTDIKLRTGDWVQIKTAPEIAQTLDENGMLDGLPFMPEMTELCGKHARVSRRAEKTCVEYPGGGYKIREFQNCNTVLLEGIRCSGDHHDGCQRACNIFWNESWLHKVDHQQSAEPGGCSQTRELRLKLKTKASPTRYICQSTELGSATKALTRRRMFLKSFLEVRSGSRGVWEMARMVIVPLWRKATRRIPRRRLSGALKRTPVGHLALQPGEWVTIKPASEIALTLDSHGRNRGLSCDFGMSNHSGKEFRVRNRLDCMISEATGEMRHVEATVVLDGLNCTCANVLGGCPRQDFMYWREIWLKRIREAQDFPAAASALAASVKPVEQPESANSQSQSSPSS